MKLHSHLGLLVLIAILFATNSQAKAEGILGVSFSKECMPLIQNNTEVLAILSKFTIEDAGKGLNAMGPGEDGTGLAFPMVFRARLKGADSGPTVHIIIDYMMESPLRIAIIGMASTEALTDGKRNLGVMIWPITE